MVVHLVVELSQSLVSAVAVTSALLFYSYRFDSDAI